MSPRQMLVNDGFLSAAIVFGLMNVCALWILEAFAEITEKPTIDVTLSIEVVKPANVCNKAVAILKTAKIPMTEADAKAYLLVDGQTSVGKCLEVIFSDASSPTNGYRVHEVAWKPSSAMVGAQ